MVDIQFLAPALAETVFAETGVVETSVAETGIVETGVAETGVAEAVFAETGVVETGVAEAVFAETGVVGTGDAETGTVETGVAVIGVAEAVFAETGVAETGVVETGVVETGVVETSVAETGVAVAVFEEIGVVETGVAETGAAETGVAVTGVVEAAVAEAGDGPDYFDLHQPWEQLQSTGEKTPFCFSTRRRRFELATLSRVTPKTMPKSPASFQGLTTEYLSTEQKIIFEVLPPRRKSLSSSYHMYDLHFLPISSIVQALHLNDCVDFHLLSNLFGLYELQSPELCSSLRH